MIKCPQCLQLRDESTDLCPHCGEELYGVRCKPSQRVADVPAEPRGPQAPARSPRGRFGDAELDFGDVSTAGLDLADDFAARSAVRSSGRVESSPSLSETPVARPIEADGEKREDPLDEMEVSRLASFGAAAAGPRGAVTYFLRVYKRRGDLRVDRSEASFSLEDARSRRDALLAEIGRRALAERADHASGDHLVAAARAAEARRDDLLRRAEDGERSIASEIEGLRRRIAELDAEIEPLAAEAERETLALEAMRAETKRAELAYKRAEIERRNVVELIAKRQETYADPTRSREEKASLLAEIADLDNRSPGLNAGVDAALDAFDRLRVPFEAASKRREVLAADVAERTARLESLRAELEGAQFRLSRQRSRTGTRVDAEKRGAERALAALGESRLPTLDRRAGPLAETARGADAVRAEIASLERRIALIDAASRSFEAGPYARGKAFALAAAGAVIALMVAAVIALVV